MAGKLNDTAAKYVQNLHKTIHYAEKIRKAGFAVFVPGIDFLMGLEIGNWEYEDYFENSQAWLMASDAMFLVPGWETSNGTKREIECARQNGIPIMFEIEELKEWFRLKQLK